MKFKTHIAVLGLILILLCMIMCGLATMLSIQAGETAVAIIKVNTKITKKVKIKFTSLDNFLLYRIVKVFHFI